MAGPGICVLCLADTCTSEVHPVFNTVLAIPIRLLTSFSHLPSEVNSKYTSKIYKGVYLLQGFTVNFNAGLSLFEKATSGML